LTFTGSAITRPPREGSLGPTECRTNRKSPTDVHVSTVRGWPHWEAAEHSCIRRFAAGSWIVEHGGMQGRSRPDRELLDAAALCRHLVPEGSVHADPLRAGGVGRNIWRPQGHDRTALRRQPTESQRTRPWTRMRTANSAALLPTCTPGVSHPPRMNAQKCFGASGAPPRVRPACDSVRWHPPPSRHRRQAGECPPPFGLANYGTQRSMRRSIGGRLLPRFLPPW
jgi:hypothetical protein